MAISWGTEVKNSTGNGMRVGYEFSQSPSSVGTGTSSVTVTCKVYVWTRRSVYDSNNTFSISGGIGSWSGDVNISHGNNGGTTLVRTMTKTVSTSYSGSVSTSVSISLSGIAPISGTARASGSWSTGKRPISAPASPSNLNVSRSSDTRQNLSWTRASSPTGAPVQQQEIRRWDITRASGNYVTIATVSGTATSFTDSSTGANQQYRYAVRSKNSAGVSSFIYSGYIATTPAAPASLAAQKQGSDIKLSWSLAGVRKSDGIEIWLTPDGVDASSRHVLLTGRPTSWTHTNPDPSKTWRYRVKTREEATGSETGPTLYSAFSGRSNIVQLLSPPSAPSKLAPTVAHDASDQIQLTWQHNAIDTTDQTGYELRYRVGSGSWTTILDRASGASRRTFAPDAFENGTPVEWQVRTWGDHATASPWSAISVLVLSGRPAVTITSPAPVAEEIPVVASSRITATWSYFDPESTTQTSARIVLKDTAGVTLWQTTVNTSSTSRAVAYTLADGAQYMLTVAVKDGHGLWSDEAIQDFTVEYAKPASADVTGFWDLELGAVVLEIEHQQPATGEVAAVSAQVWHSTLGEDWAMIADGLEPSTAMVDFVPALDTVNYYRVVSISAIGSSVETAIVEVITESQGWVFVNGGPDWSVACRMRYNPTADATVGRSRTLHQFAGRTFPVEFTGQAVTRTISHSSLLVDDASTYQEIESLALLPGPHYYRDPDKRRMTVSIGDVNLSHHPAGHTLSMSFTEVEGV